MKIIKEKHIGRVLFIVEGSKSEFNLMRKIFCDVLKYEYIEKRRNRPDRDIDNFHSASKEIYNLQDGEYFSGIGFKVFSMLTLAFLQLGIIELT
jgi:hypothetical protein